MQGDDHHYHTTTAAPSGWGFGQAQVPMASALETSPRGERSDGASSSYVSLRRLSVWLAEPARRLRLLAVLCDATRRKRGGALLRALHEHTKHGDPATRTTCDRLLAAAAAPTLATLKMWVVRGELDDPRGEFFVASDPTVGEDDLWRRGYRIEYAMMPPFVDVDLARDALKAGKSINFLRRRCGDDAAWAAEQAPVLVAAENAGGLRYGNARALRALVTEAKRRIDAAGGSAELVMISDALPEGLRQAHEAATLLVRSGASLFLNRALGADDLLDEHERVAYDTRFWHGRQKKTMCLRARHNASKSASTVVVVVVVVTASTEVQVAVRGV